MNEEAWFGLYRLFRAIGMPRVTVPVEVKKGRHTYTLPIGWPELKIAITLDSADGKKFKQEGWQVVYIPANSLSAAEPIIHLLDELVRKRTVADSFAEAEMTVSKTENKLLEALLRAGLPEPDRNFKFLDQHRVTITIPDFVWEEAKVAVFVDGEFFHGLKDLGDSLQLLMNADPDLKGEFTGQAKDTMARDAAKRRKLTKAGWRVIVVTASEIDTGELDGIVNDIVTAVRQAPRPVPAEDLGVEAVEESGWILPERDEGEDAGEENIFEDAVTEVESPTQLFENNIDEEPAGTKYDLPPPSSPKKEIRAPWETEQAAGTDDFAPWQTQENFFQEEEEERGEEGQSQPSWLKKEVLQEPEGTPYDLPPP